MDGWMDGFYVLFNSSLVILEQVCVIMKCCVQWNPVYDCKRSIYSRTSMARTLMARLVRPFRTRSRVPRKNPIAADLE